MPRWARYLIVFLFGGLTALIFNSSLFFRKVSPQPIKQAVTSEGVATASGDVNKGFLGLAQDGAETVQVVRVIDGDTVELEGGRRVRYIGIDTPEVGDARGILACFGKEATEENKRLVEGKAVRLEKDISETDRYGRLLRYVYISSPAGEFVNDYLVRQGFAKAATFPPDVTHQEQFLEAEREAREQGRGLWGGCINK